MLHVMGLETLIEVFGIRDHSKAYTSAYEAGALRESQSLALIWGTAKRCEVNADVCPKSFSAKLRWGKMA